MAAAVAAAVAAVALAALVVVERIAPVVHRHTGNLSETVRMARMWVTCTVTVHVQGMHCVYANFAVVSSP